MPSEPESFRTTQALISLYFSISAMGLTMLFWGASNLHLTDENLFRSSVILGFIIMTIGFFGLLFNVIGFLRHTKVAKKLIKGKIISKDAIKAGLNTLWDYTIALVAALMGGVTFYVLQNIFPNPKDLQTLLIFVFIMAVIFILILGGIVIIVKSLWLNRKRTRKS